MATQFNAEDLQLLTGYDDVLCVAAGGATKATIEGAADGTLVRLLPGTHDVGDNGIVVPAGVDVAGAGMDLTTLTGDRTGLAASFLKPGTRSTIRDLHVDFSALRGAEDGTSNIPIGKVAGDAAFHHAKLLRVRITSYSDCIYIVNPDPSDMGLTIEDCEFETNIDAIVVTGTNTNDFFIRIKGGHVTLKELNPEESDRNLVVAPWSDCFDLDIRDLGTEPGMATVLYEAAKGRLIRCTLYSTSDGAVHIEANEGSVEVADSIYDPTRTSGTIATVDTLGRIYKAIQA